MMFVAEFGCSTKYNMRYDIVICYDHVQYRQRWCVIPYLSKHEPHRVKSLLTLLIAIGDLFDKHLLAANPIYNAGSLIISARKVGLETFTNESACAVRCDSVV